MTINHEELRKRASNGIPLDWRGTLALLDEIAALKDDRESWRMLAEGRSEEVATIMSERDDLIHDINRGIEANTSLLATHDGLRNAAECACNALADSILCSGNDAQTNMMWVSKLRKFLRDGE